MNTYIEQANEHLLHTYNRYPYIWEKGEGCYLYDISGKKYLDFVSGIGVFALGHGNKPISEAIKNQVDKLTHTSNYYYNLPAIAAAATLTEKTGLPRVFFANSGTEAVEGALKAARKYAYLREGRAGHGFLAFHRAFHGRTLGSLSVTGTEKYRLPFAPLVSPVSFADFNDFSSVKENLDESTCAIILETVQGEGGIYPADYDFLQDIRALCTDCDILLIIDEVQCGMGRTGSLFAYEQYGIKPDILVTAKALGGGVPMGAFLVSEKLAQMTLAPGDHGTTFGGNPLACAAMNAVFREFERANIIERVRETAPYLEKRLDEIVGKFDAVLGQRGRGLLRGLECKEPVAQIINRALELGLVLINAGEKVIRFIPPLIVTTAEVDEMTGILSQAIDESL